MALGIAVGL